MNDEELYPDSMLEVLNAAQGIVTAIIHKNHDSSVNTLANIILPNEDSASKISSLAQTPRSIFFFEAQKHFTQITLSYQALRHLPHIFALRPSADSPITPHVFQTFWREASLNETYIFYNAVQSFASHLSRKHKSPELAAFLKSFQENVDKDWKPLLNVRGAHVHDTRYARIDSSLIKLMMLEIIRDRDTATQTAYENFIKECDTLTNNILKGYGTDAKKILTKLFDEVKKYLVDENGNFQFPSHLLKSKNDPF